MTCGRVFVAHQREQQVLQRGELLVAFVGQTERLMKRHLQGARE
jgi:hypothetical protein